MSGWPTPTRTISLVSNRTCADISSIIASRRSTRPAPERSRRSTSMPALITICCPTTTKQTALAQPTALAFEANGLACWVAAFGSDRVARFDTATGAVLTRIETGPTTGIAADPAHKRGPRGLALQATTGRLFVLNRLSNSLTVMGTARVRRSLARIHRQLRPDARGRSTGARLPLLRRPAFRQRHPVLRRVPHQRGPRRAGVGSRRYAAARCKPSRNPTRSAAAPPSPSRCTR